MPEFLLELLSEEIPARMQARAAEYLKRRVADELKKAGLAFDRAEAFVTPRRLALVIDGLPEKTEVSTEEKRGPRTDAPDKAIQGFLKANGLTLEECEKRDTGKGEFWFAVIEIKGGPTTETLLDLLGPIIGSFPWPKSMRWGDARAAYVRPLRRILFLFDGKPVDGCIHFEGSVNVEFGNRTFGHRFLAPGEIQVTGFEDYRKKLRDAYVILDPTERREVIATRAAEIAGSEGLQLRGDPALLDEVAGLVEWPVALAGSIDEAFMDVPDEVLITSMRTHQKYLSLLKPDGSLAPRFVMIANTEAVDNGAQIVAGNERVLRARLADAKFFWDKDLETRLEERVPALDHIVFHAKLGSLGEKVARVQTLAAELCEFIPGCDRDLARSAALLAKTDLTTGMVGEFPELQGVMGCYYAIAEGAKAEVAEAIAKHYAPQGPNDRCPTAPVSIAVALADKIDTLAGFWAIDEKPSGSRDPYALRRAALGVIRLILENGLRLPLRNVFEMAWHGGSANADATIAELLAFFADRLKVHLREEGVRHDLISAVFALPGEDDLVRLMARVEALKSFLDSDDGANLLIAHKRAANIVRIEEEKDGGRYDQAVDPSLLRQDDEKALDASLTETTSASSTFVKGENFDGAMAALAKLRRPVDAFFDNVTVNCDESDLRRNRLRLLSQIRATMGEIADFSQIEG